jgi:ABC-type dipeptide/oligopeptide/nickel transport system permease component
MIFRLAPALRFRHFLRGYHFGYNRYDVFFRRNFAWLIVVFAYITIVLTAMQVGLATSNLSQDSKFQSASYGFAVFSIIVPVIMVGILLIFFVVLFTSNLLSTIINLYRKRQSQKNFD